MPRLMPMTHRCHLENSQAAAAARFAAEPRTMPNLHGDVTLALSTPEAALREIGLCHEALVKRNILGKTLHGITLPPSPPSPISTSRTF